MVLESRRSDSCQAAMSKQRDFYIPNSWAWNHRLVSEVYVNIQKKRAIEEQRHAQGTLDVLDLDVLKIEQEIKGKWADANVQIMRAFQARLKEIGAQRKRVAWVLRRLDGVLVDMEDIAKERGWS
jgi:hypothetical protein